MLRTLFHPTLHHAAFDDQYASPFLALPSIAHLDPHEAEPRLDATKAARQPGRVFRPAAVLAHRLANHRLQGAQQVRSGTLEAGLALSESDRVGSAECRIGHAVGYQVAAALGEFVSGMLLAAPPGGSGRERASRLSWLGRDKGAGST